MDEQELLNNSSRCFEQILANATLDLQAALPGPFAVAEAFVPDRERASLVLRKDVGGLLQQWKRQALLVETQRHTQVGVLRTLISANQSSHGDRLPRIPSCMPRLLQSALAKHLRQQHLPRTPLRDS